MSAQPIVSFLDGAALNAPIGGTQTITVRFDNAPDGGGLSNVGYSPYINLILPTNGVDGAGAGNSPVNDGIAYLGATYLGVALEQWVLEFPASGQVTHPFTTDSAGAPVIVSGAPGTTLVVLRLPFGSFTPGQTAADVQVSLDVSDFADLGAPLLIQASGGFAYGRDPLVNPVADNPVFAATASLSITPTVIELDKVYVGPEQETATGSSYPREWLVKALIADGQTVTNLVLTDHMPDGTLITGASIVNGTGTVTFDNATGLVVATLTGSYTGGIGGVPTLKIDFYVPEFLRDGVTPVLDPVTGAFRVLEDNARLDAVWDPTDGRDPIEVFAIDPTGPEDVITAKSIAVQKSVSVVDALKPGGHLEWTLDGQVSNYFNMDDLVLTDTLSDGHVYDPAFAATITMREGGATLFSGTIDPVNISVVRDPLTGISTIRFDVSKEMRDRGIDDVLNGQPGGNDNQATVLVKFHSIIEQTYVSTTPAPSNEPVLDQGDPLTNGVIFDGVVDETDRPKGDDSGAGVVLPVSNVGKSIYAINGNTGFTPGPVSAGDAITFRLTLDMPLTGAHDVALSDFLPLPVLKAIAGMTFTDTVSAAAPGAGQAKWGPGATFDSSGDPTTNPTISFDAASNFLRFDFGDAQAPGNPSSRIDLLFTVVVEDQEFGDGLLLTNQVTSTETNSFGAVSEDNAIVQFVLGEPELNITKGVIADTNANANLTGAAGPVAFTAPGTAGNRFTGTISSTALDAAPIDANLLGADAGDRVSFAIVVENTGSSLKGAFDVLIRDTMPAGFEIPVGGINLRVTHAADSDAPAYDLALSDLIPAGMELVGGTLVASAGTASSAGNAISWTASQHLLGAGAITITYQARLLDSVTPAQVLSNTARLTYDTKPADPVDPLNPTAAEDLASRSYTTQDTETRSVALAPTIDKSVIATGDANTASTFVNAANPDAAPGETVTYRLTVTVGEGTQRLVVSDNLPAGLIFESASVESIGATITGSSLSVGAAATTISGGAYSFDFGTVVNAGDNDRDAGDTVTILVTGRVATTATAGSTLTNTASAETYAPGGGKPGLATVTDDAKIDVVRPDLVIVKDAAPGIGDAGNVVTYTITLTHAAGSTSPAYLVNLTDLLPAGVSLLAGTATASAGIISESGGNISYSLSQYLLGAAPITISYQARLAANVVDGQSILNTAQVSYSSAPVLGVSQTESDPATVGVDIVNTVVKTLESTSLLGTIGSAVGIGEDVTFLVTATLGEGNQRIVLRDVLPTGLDFVDSELVSLGGITGSALSIGADGVYDAGTRTLSFNLGDISNPWDNMSNTADQVVFRVVARVADISGNGANTVLTNVGQVVSSAPANPYGVTPGSSSTTVSENEAITVVRASLGGIAFRDVDGDGVREAGDTVLAGIPVTLLKADGTLAGFTAVTGPDGSYLFDDLIPGSYRVRFDEVGGNERTLTDVGIETTDSDANQGSGITGIYTLANGQNLRNVDAGFYQLASIGDRVWEDINGDGLQNDGATGLVGATVLLLDGLGNTVTSTVTGADGVYQFTGLTPGDYSIQVLPAGYTATPRNVGPDEAADSDINTLGRSDVFNLESGETEARLDAGLYRGARLGGTVFEDVEGNGLQGGPGEGGMSGRVVTLLDIAGNSTGRTAITDSNGNYLFEGLQPGTYSVQFAPDAGTPFTTANTGLDNASDSDANVITGKTEQVTLASGGDDCSLDAGVYRPAAIGDRVWEDVNGNGQQDGGEPGIVGATVRLLDGSGNVLQTVLSGTNGAYAFTGLAPADYRVEIVKAGYTPTTQDSGTDGSDSDIAADGRTAIVNLISGETDSSVDGGLYRPASLGNRVWLDADNDGIQDLGEAGISGVIVRLLKADGTATGLTTVTDGSGAYGFANLAPGDYRVEFVAPANKAFAKQDIGVDADDSDADRTTGRTDIITLTSGESDGTIDAGLVELGDLTGRVWLDQDGDGTQEPGEGGITGITVNLLNADGSPTGRTTVTGSHGTYLFEDVIAGDYRVEFMTPGGTRITLRDQGGNELIDSDANPADGITDLVTVVAAETTRYVDAGIYIPASIGNRVWEDTNGDGLQNDGATGLVGATVLLLDGLGNTVTSTVTGADGVYQFTGLTPGDYSIQVLPAGYTATPRNVGPDEAADSDINTLGRSDVFNLESGETEARLDAGLYRGARLGGTVFEDVEGNGLQGGPGEGGMSGRVVTLLDIAGNSTGRTAITDSNGNYLFEGLQPGTYSVQFAPDAGTPFTTANTGLDNASDSDANVITGKTEQVTLASGGDDRSLDAGVYIPATIGDFVWEDVNGNGIQDGGELGIGGVTVQLHWGGTGVTSTVTDSDGFYQFTGVRPGTYSLIINDPIYKPTLPNRGGDDAKDSDFLPSPSPLGWTSSYPVALASSPWCPVRMTRRSMPASSSSAI